MAGIIKSGILQDGPTAAQVASFNFEDLSHKADAYLQAIRGQAAQILVKAKERAAVIEDDARQRGKQEALREIEQLSHAQVEHQMQTLLPALQEAIESIRHARESWVKQWEQNTVHLARAIASRVIRRELSHHPEIALDWLRESLELVTGEGTLTVRLHPQDFEVLGKRAQLLTDQLSRIGSSKIVADPSIDPGGCRVESEFGSVDQQVESQLQRIEDELTRD